MIPALRALALRRDLLVARSAVQRGEIRAVLEPAALRLAAAESVLRGVRQVLFWAARLAPLYALFRRLRSK